ncbi:MAG: hypothetical protein ABI618_21070 [Nitrospirota bacterium]
MGGAYGGVREPDHGATCLRACASKRASARRREAAPAKAGNAAGGPFDFAQGMFFQQPQHGGKVLSVADATLH